MRRFQVTAKAIEVEMQRDVPVDKSRLPPWMRLIARNEQTMQHRTTWRRADPKRVTAELDILPLGLPISAHGSGTIVEHRSGTTCMVLAWQVHSVLGEKIERMFADQIQTAVDDDHVFTLQYLKRVVAP